MADEKKPFDFKERYEGDEAFRKRVDARRADAAAKRGTETLNESLKMVRGDHGARRKLY